MKQTRTLLTALLLCISHPLGCCYYLVEVFVNGRQAMVAADMDWQAANGFDAYSFGAPTTIKKVEIWKVKPTNRGDALVGNLRRARVCSWLDHSTSRSTYARAMRR